MTRKIYDLAVVTGTYESQGQTKNRYQNIGVVLEKDDGGRFIMLERTFNPAGVPHDSSRGNSIIIGMFEPRQQEGQQSAPRANQQHEPARRQSPFSQDGTHGPAAQAQSAPGDEFSDTIPF